MHARWLAGLAVFAGCFSPSTPPDGGSHGGDDAAPGSDSNSGAIAASWTLATVAGGVGTCSTDAPTMKVSVTALDASGTEDGPPTVVLFDCGAGSGKVDVPHTADGADTGTFHVRWDLTDSTGDTVMSTDVLTQISAQTVIDTATSRTATTSFLVDGAYAWLEWSLADASDTPFTTCADANVDTIDVVLSSSGTPITLAVPCDGDNGRTTGFETQGEGSVGGVLSAITLADYSIEATAKNGGASVGDTTTTVQLFLDTLNGVSPTPQQLAITVTN